MLAEGNGFRHWHVTHVPKGISKHTCQAIVGIYTYIYIYIYIFTSDSFKSIAVNCCSFECTVCVDGGYKCSLMSCLRLSKTGKHQLFHDCRIVSQTHLLASFQKLL